MFSSSSTCWVVEEFLPVAPTISSFVAVSCIRLMPDLPEATQLGVSWVSVPIQRILFMS